MLEKVKMLINNNGVGAVKKFTPPSTPLNHVSRGGWKKNFGALRAPLLPLTQISPPPRSFPRSTPGINAQKQTYILISFDVNWSILDVFIVMFEMINLISVRGVAASNAPAAVVFLMFTKPSKWIHTRLGFNFHSFFWTPALYSEQ